MMIPISDALILCLFALIAGLIFGSMLAGIGKPDPNAGGLLDYQFQQFLKKDGITINVHITPDDHNKYLFDKWMST